MSLIAAPIESADADLRESIVRRLLRNPLTVASLLVLLAFLVVAAIQPWITPSPPNTVDLSRANVPPLTDGYVLGGDQFGRDILSRIVASSRTALVSVAALALVAFVVGTIAGLIAGYFGGLVDSLTIWVFSVIMAAPAIVILISLYTVLGTSTPLMMTAYGFLVSPYLVFMVRTLTRDVRNELYVDAARVSGLSNARIIGRHVLVAIRAPVILMTASLAGAGIGLQAGLEFLGLSDPSQPSWGGMLADAFTNLYIAPVQIVWPAAAIGLITAAFSFISFGLRDTLEGTKVKQSTRQREREIARLRPLAVDSSVRASAHPAPERGQVSDAPLLRIEDLQIGYAENRRLSVVVDDVSLEVRRGEIVGVVGESGSGKSQTVFATLGLLPPEAIVLRGSIRLDGIELLGLPESDMARYRGREIAYVPQEPMANLDPTFTVGSQLVYGIRAQTGQAKKDAAALALAMLERVGIRDPKRVFKSYPHQISGGMAQRVLIAGAVACRPRLLIADEPTTALDVTIQAEVLDLLRDLQREIDMGVLIVTHNFGVVADLCDRVVVMKSGEVVEQGPVDRVFTNPAHDYTKMLLASALDHAPPRRDLANQTETTNV